MSSKPLLPPQSKLFFRIGEVSRATGLEPYVLRYWESEFPELRSVKGTSKQRLYDQEDIDRILRIKQMLYHEGYTIAGARKKLAGRREPDRNMIIESAQKELKEILELLA